MRKRNARIGLILFTVYLLFYGGFVLLNAFAPQTMEVTPITGINLAIIFGFALIIMALVLAIVYGLFCKPENDETATREEGE